MHCILLFSPENMFAGICMPSFSLKVKIYNAPADVSHLIIDTFAGEQQLFGTVHACWYALVEESLYRI
jgi:hypothetical protein